MCGEKQSLKKVYVQGRALDCRKHVQKLNMLRGDSGAISSMQIVKHGDNAVNYTLSPNGGNSGVAHQNLCGIDEHPNPMKSKWSKFMAEECRGELCTWSQPSTDPMQKGMSLFL